MVLKHYSNLLPGSLNLLCTSRRETACWRMGNHSGSFLSLTTPGSKSIALVLTLSAALCTYKNGTLCSDLWKTAVWFSSIGSAWKPHFPHLWGDLIEIQMIIMQIII